VTPSAGFGQLLGEWLPTIGSPNTRAAYRTDLGDYAAWCARQGQSPLAAGPAEIERYRGHCEAMGASPAVVARRLSAVSSFYRYAAASEAVTANPVMSVTRPSTEGRLSEPALEEQEAQALLDAAAALGPKVAALVGLLLLDGLKLGEVLSLDTGDLSGTGDGTVAAVTRRGVRQQVPLDQRTASAITVYLAGRTSGPLLLGDSPTQNRNGRLTRFGADFLLKRATGKAGLERRISANVLRSTYITAAHRRGTALADIQRHVGHLHTRDTRRYLDGYGSTRARDW
jgi:integrase/recombinase XerD